MALNTPGRANIDNAADLVGLLAWFVVPGALAFLAGRSSDPIAAGLVLLGVIVGAGAVAWVAGVPEVRYEALEAMRSSYHVMKTLIAAGASAVLGLVVVLVGYRVGHRSRGDKPEVSVRA